MTKKGDSFGQFNKIWDFFTSVRLTVVILLSLAVTSIVGTVIPQNESHAAYHDKYGDFLYKLFYVLDIYDMYHSWWFRFLLLALTANILVCSVDRLSSTWKVIFPKKRNFAISRFRKVEKKEKFKTTTPPERLVEAFMPIIQKRFAYATREETDNGHAIFAEKGRWTRVGVYIVHLSVILLIFGGLIGSIFGFEGYAMIPEGSSESVINLKNSNKKVKLDFEIRCDDFNVSFYPTGAPKEFKSELVLLRDGKEIYKKDIVVNHPLRWEGINIYQSSYGKMPFDIMKIKGEGVSISFTNPETGMTYTNTLVLGKPVAIPEGGGTLVIDKIEDHYLFMGQRDLGEALKGTITPVSGEPEEIVLPVQFPKFDRMRKGDLVVSLVHDHSRYYTGLQVTKDPGVLLVYVGFIIMIAGFFITFFMSHQRIAIEIQAKGNKCEVITSGIANKNSFGMEKRVGMISRDLALIDKNS